jgi:5-methylcytosine-specific restriction protein A
MPLMAWETSTRRTRLPADWKARRAAARRRAGGRCEGTLTDGTRCPNQGTDADHLIPGDDHSPANLRWLCRPCHIAKTTAEAAARNRARAAARRRPPERHPGLLGHPGTP